MTALPRWPGNGPELYHPTSSQGFPVGVSKSPSAKTPTDSMKASSLIAGITRRTGCTLALSCVNEGGIDEEVAMCGGSPVMGKGLCRDTPSVITTVSKQLHSLTTRIIAHAIMCLFRSTY